MGVRFPQGVHKCWVRIDGQFIRLSIINEIKKCVVLCANFHRKVHACIIRLEDYDTNAS